MEVFALAVLTANSQRCRVEMLRKNTHCHIVGSRYVNIGRLRTASNLKSKAKPVGDPAALAHAAEADDVEDLVSLESLETINRTPVRYSSISPNCKFNAPTDMRISHSEIVNDPTIRMRLIPKTTFPSSI